MRKVSEQVVSAFLNGKEKKVGNTSTDGKILRLHGNIIAKRFDDGEIRISSGGWQSATTKDRLNALLFFMQRTGYDMSVSRVYQQDYAWYVTTPEGKRDFESGMIAGRLTA